MATQSPHVEEELRDITRTLKREQQNGHRMPQAPKLAQPGPAREGVAEDLATFIEKHAEDLVREAQEHLESAREFADEIRRRTDEKAAELRAFTDSIKASRSGMEEVRTNFLQVKTSGITPSS